LLPTHYEREPKIVQEADCLDVIDNGLTCYYPIENVSESHAQRFSGEEE